MKNDEKKSGERFVIDIEDLQEVKVDGEAVQAAGGALAKGPGEPEPIQTTIMCPW